MAEEMNTLEIVSKLKKICYENRRWIRGFRIGKFVKKIEKWISKGVSRWRVFKNGKPECLQGSESNEKVMNFVKITNKITEKIENRDDSTGKTEI